MRLDEFVHVESAQRRANRKGGIGTGFVGELDFEKGAGRVIHILTSMRLPSSLRETSGRFDSAQAMRQRCAARAMRVKRGNFKVIPPM